MGENNTKKQLYKSICAIMEHLILSMKRFFKNIVIDEESFLVQREEVKYWKNKIYYITSAAILTLAAPLMIYATYLVYLTGDIIVATIELLLYITCIIVISSKKLSITAKKFYIAYGFYITSIILLLTTDTMGIGMVCIVFALILSGCLLDKKQIVLFVLFNLLVFMLLTVLLFIDVFEGSNMERNKQIWFLYFFSVQTCGIISLLLMNSIFTGLERQAQRVKKSETQLTASEIKHKAMLSNISDAIVIIDPQGMVTYSSPNLLKRFPSMYKELKAGCFYDVLHPDDRVGMRELIEFLLLKKGRKRTMEARYLGKNNEVRYLELTAVNLTEDVNINGILINYSDTTKRRVREQEIIYLNQHDSLTGLYNRSFFEMEKERLDQEGQLPLSIIIGDINGLKIINDSLGHAEGDKLLITISNLIAKSCRFDDIVARIGGDEFNILLPRTTLEEALEIIHKINQECDRYNRQVVGELYHLSISLGAATKVLPEESLDNAQKIAEDYMYKRKLLEGRSYHSSIISSMKMALFEKSHETQQHAQRMIELTKDLGKAIGLSDQQFDELELFSTIHDIGKIGIEDQILNKPEILTAEEWVKMRKHCEIGYRIAMASPELMSIAYYILTHHERWDGTGYPQGLKGASIPLLSRILSLADSYDAMIEDRPYRKGISKEEAIIEIEQNSGTQFDPELAATFIHILKNR